MSNKLPSEGGVLPFSESAWQRSNVMNNAVDPATAQGMRNAVQVQRENNAPRATEITHGGPESFHRTGLLASATDRNGMPVETLSDEHMLRWVENGHEVRMSIRDARVADIIGKDADGRYFEIDQSRMAQHKADIKHAERQEALANRITVEPRLEAAHSELLGWMAADGLKPEQLIVQFVHNGEQLPPHVAEWAQARGIPGGSAGLQAHYSEFMNKLVINALGKSVLGRGVHPDAFTSWMNNNGIVTSADRIGALLELYLSGGHRRLDALVTKFRETGGKVSSRSSGTFIGDGPHSTNGQRG
jgi:hypothetical protein